MRPRSWAQGLNGSEGGGLRRKPAICRLVEQDFVQTQVKVSVCAKPGFLPDGAQCAFSCTAGGKNP